MVDFVRSLMEKLFGTGKQRPDANSNMSSSVMKTPTNHHSRPVHSGPVRKDPYFIQIGFDFGTSYSKCICRDMMTNKAWVHLHPGSDGQELPFLIPSGLLLNNRRIAHVEDPKTHYPENGLYHLKHAMVKVALRQGDDPVLRPFWSAVRSTDWSLLSEFVEACAVYFLAGALGEVREKVRLRFPGFGKLPEDYMAVNLAVPVGDAEQPEVSELYNRILCEAWSLADHLSGRSPIHLTEMESLLKKSQGGQERSAAEACFIYPEVSANVQGFVRSRVSSPGVYLFSDTGGGTVDQSIFIFMREDQGEHLLYLTGRVLPLGSSHIERLAAESCGKMDCQSLEFWRERKERGEADNELREAQGWIAKKLNRGTETTLALAKRKLFVPDQLTRIRVIFGGGGHSEYPYRTAAMCPFSGSLFRECINPDVVGMPVPRDLELKSHENRWMRRLSVAYGLSFEKSELARFTYPKDVSTPTPDEIWQPRKQPFHIVGKDEC